MHHVLVMPPIDLENMDEERVRKQAKQSWNW